MLCCDQLFFNSSDWCIWILAVHSVICSLGGPLSHGSPVVVFFDRGHPRFWNFYSTIPVDVVRVKSYMNCLVDLMRVIIRVTINKLYVVPEACVRCCGYALKRRRSRGRVECLDRAPLILSCMGLPVSHRPKKTSSMQWKRRDLHHA